MIDADTCEWLVGDGGRAWLARAAELTGTAVQRAARLRRELSAERTAAVLGQLELRERARAKFLAADRLFFQAVPLEQATDQAIAEYKARRFDRFDRVSDLCCGIGGDLMSLATKSQTIGLDRDPAVTVFAQANLNALGRPGQVATMDFTPEAVAADAWHIDPDRRPAGRRTTHLEIHEPRPDLIEQLFARHPHGAIKLAPATDLPLAWSTAAEREWISRAGECKQQVVWFGDLSQGAGQVRATLLARALDTPADRAVLATVAGPPSMELPHAAAIGRYVLEPDAAVLAADLAGHLAKQHSLAAITPGIAYLTGDYAVADPALACFEVLESMPYRPARLAAWLKERHIGRLEIKKRGVTEDPAKVRKLLRVDGDNAATILLLPVARSVTAIIARRTAARDEQP